MIIKSGVPYGNISTSSMLNPFLTSSLLLMLFILLTYGEMFRGKRKLLEKGVPGKLEMGIR